MKIEVDFTVLLILFVAAKLFGAIDWSWWWVLCPLWMPPALVVCIGALCAAIGLLCEVVRKFF